MFTLTFSTDNAAFEDAPILETEAVIRRVLAQVAAGDRGGKARDSNGNTIGQWALTENSP